MTWKKGVSGNPGGRARWEKPFREALDRLVVAAAEKNETKARTFAELAAERIVTIVLSGNDRDAVRAIIAGRTHGWGHPKQEIDLHTSRDLSDVTGMSDEELIAIATATDHTG